MVKCITGLLLVFVFFTCGGQNQRSIPKQSNRTHRSGLSESQLVEAAASKVPMSMVRNVRQAKNGDILIASYVGVYRYNSRLNDGAELATSFTNLTKSIEWPTFWDVLEDKKGNLWLASQDSGVYLQSAGQKDIKLFRAKDGTGVSSALHIYEDRAGNIWFGASRFDGKTFRTFTTQDGFPTNNIRLLLEDKTGKLWFGAQGEDLFIYDARLSGPLSGGNLVSYRDGQRKKFTVLRDKDGKAFNNVWSIIEDKNGNFWFGADGLWRYDGKTFTKVSDRGAYAIIEDKDGNIWTTGGIKINGGWALTRYDHNSLYTKNPTFTEIFSVKEGALLGMIEAKDGSIWFGAMGPQTGVYRYDGKILTNFKSNEVEK